MSTYDEKYDSWFYSTLKSKFGPMHWSENNVDLILDDANNRDVVVNILKDVFDNLEIPNLRQGGIEKLVDAGYERAEDIINLSETELKSIIGDSAGSKVYNGLKEKLNPVELHILAGASQKYGRGMGRRKLVKIVDHYGPEKFLDGSLTLDDIRAVDGFERTTAQLYVDNHNRFLQFFKDIEGKYTLDIKEKVVGGDLEGVNFMFTGFRDKEAEKDIVARGGTIQSSVNKDTTYLVTKDINSTSSKAEKARKLGVKIIDPIEFRNIING